MRVKLLLWLGLSSCSLLVRSIDPCVGNTPNSDKLCFFQNEAKTSGQVVQAKVADIDGDALPDLVMRTNNSGSLQIEALLSTNNFAVSNISQESGINENVFSFDVADMNDVPALGAPAHIIMLTATESIILSLPSPGAESRINISGFQNRIAFGPIGEEIFINTTNPRAIVSGNFIPDGVIPESIGREIAVAYTNSDVALIGNPTPNVTNIAVFDVGVGPNNARFVTEDIEEVSGILEMGAHNVNGDNNGFAEEFFLVVQNTDDAMEGIFFLNNGNPIPPNRESLAGPLGVVQIVNFNNDAVLDLLVADNSSNTLHSFVIQSGGGQPSIDFGSSTSLSLSDPTSAVGLVRLGDNGQHIMLAGAGIVEIIERAPNGELTLSPDVLSIDSPAFLFAFDADAVSTTNAENLLISTENNDLLTLIAK